MSGHMSITDSLEHFSTLSSRNNSDSLQNSSISSNVSSTYFSTNSIPSTPFNYFIHDHHLDTTTSTTTYTTATSDINVQDNTKPFPANPPNDDNSLSPNPSSLYHPDNSLSTTDKSQSPMNSLLPSNLTMPDPTHLDSLQDSVNPECSRDPLRNALEQSTVRDRLDELKHSGCSTRIQWSRFGGLAAILPDSLSVHVYNFWRNLSTGQWQLSKPIPLAFPSIQGNTKFCHISWSYLGNDLAVVDTVGRVYLFTMSSTLGRLNHVYTCSSNSSCFSAIIGMYWLPVFPQNQKTTVFWRSSRNHNNIWTYDYSNIAHQGPRNPADGRAAVLFVTKDSRLTLVYQLPSGNQWKEISYNLIDSPSIPDLLLSHAAFAPNDAPKDETPSLWLATYNLSDTLRVSRVEINWTSEGKNDAKVVSGSKGDGSIGQANTSINLCPSLNVEWVTSVSNCLSALDANSSDNNCKVDGTSAYLTHLDFYVKIPHPDENEFQKPLIISVFHKPCPNVITTQNGDEFPKSDTYNALVVGWELISNQANGLLDAFNSLSRPGGKLVTCSLGPSYSLEKKLQHTFPSPIVSVIPQRMSSILCVIFSNGSIEFFHFPSLKAISMESNPEVIKNMYQVGFQFRKSTEFSCNVALSPNSCVAASLLGNGVVKLRKLHNVFVQLSLACEETCGDGLLAQKRGEVETKMPVSVAVALSLQHSSACGQLNATDDLMALLPRNIHVSLQRELLRQMLQAMSLTLDYSSNDLQKHAWQLFRVPAMYKIFGVQYGLGTGSLGRRSLSAKLAWVALNLKLMSTSMTLSLRQSESHRIDLVLSLSGMIHYSMDFLVYIFQELMALARHLREQKLTLTGEEEVIRGYVRRVQQFIDKTNSPALLTILSSIPRMLLRPILRSLRTGYLLAINGAKNSSTKEQREVWLRIYEIFVKSPVNLLGNYVELFFKDIDRFIEKCLASTSEVKRERMNGSEDGKGGIESNDGLIGSRAVIEREMFISGQVPIIMAPAVGRILEVLIPAIEQHLDPAKLFSHEVSWLNLNEDEDSQRFFAWANLEDLKSYGDEDSTWFTDESDDGQFRNMGDRKGFSRYSISESFKNQYTDGIPTADELGDTYEDLLEALSKKRRLSGKSETSGTTKQESKEQGQDKNGNIELVNGESKRIKNDKWNNKSTTKQKDKGSIIIDVVRKVKLQHNALLRRCTRCGSICQELNWSQISVFNQQWVVQNYKVCICSNRWAAI